MKPGEHVVELVAAISGLSLGCMKVSRSVSLATMQPRLLRAMGGRSTLHTVHVVKDNEVYDLPFSRPFAAALHGAIYGLVLVETTDMVFVDMSHRREKTG